MLRRLDDEWVLFDPEADVMHVLNSTAGMIWTQLDGRTSCEEIAASICEQVEPPITAEEVERDVRSTLHRFLEKGLLDP